MTALAYFCMDRRLARLVIPLATALALCSCTSLDAQTPDEEAAILKMIESGTVRLECSLACSHDFIFQQRKIYAQFAVGDWRGLAVAIYKTQFRKDISYYMLGVAAQGLGYHDAALTYLRYAGALSTSPMPSDQCASSKLCFDIRLPDAIYPRIRASELARSRMPTGTASGRTSAAEQAKPATSGNANKGWIDPPPATR